MNALEINNLSMRAGSFCVSEITLSVAEGQYFTLMGRTGSGKSLLLKAICGLARIDRGSIHIYNRDVTPLEPRFREIGYVPQDGGLFPHLNVQRNVMFSLTTRGISRAKAADEIEEIVQLLGLTPLLERSIRRLSGGERQKVALARALAARPRLLILDEPVCSLDEPARYEICSELRRVQTQLGITTVHVCHSRAEAEQVSDCIGVMHEGRLVETGNLDALRNQSGHPAVQRLFETTGR